MIFGDQQQGSSEGNKWTFCLSSILLKYLPFSRHLSSEKHLETIFDRLSDVECFKHKPGVQVMHSCRITKGISHCVWCKMRGESSRLAVVYSCVQVRAERKALLKYNTVVNQVSLSIHGKTYIGRASSPLHETWRITCNELCPIAPRKSGSASFPRDDLSQKSRLHLHDWSLRISIIIFFFHPSPIIPT